MTVSAPARRAGLAWPRLPAAAELTTIGAGYLGYALARLTIHADRHAAFAHAAQLWQAERRMHPRSSPGSTASPRPRPTLAEAVGWSVAASLPVTRYPAGVGGQPDPRGSVGARGGGRRCR